MAFEVYRNDNWAQLTETLEIGSIRPGDTVTVSIRNVNGARGVYIDGELLTGKAKGQGGTTAGDTINPLDYIAESDYSANGKTYVEWGLWDGGGQATVYAQTVTGSLGVLDRDGEKIRGYGIEAAFDEYGNEIPLIGSALDGDTFTLSSLTGNLIRTLKVTTAGGVSAKAKIGSGNTIEGTDYRVRVTAGEPARQGELYHSKGRKGHHRIRQSHFRRRTLRDRGLRGRIRGDGLARGFCGKDARHPRRHRRSCGNRAGGKADRFVRRACQRSYGKTRLGHGRSS